MTPQERAELIDEIAKLPEQAASAVNGLTDTQLDTPYRPGGWTPRQVIHHLADSHMNAMIRMKLILTEERPTLKPYDQDRWATLPDTSGLPPSDSLAILRGLHARWTHLLRSVNDADWSRSGIHPESGDVTVESLLRTYARHGRTHVRQILDLRSSFSR